jgi:uncharacterized membrane protein YphA (DoxX/SURF4 family)
MEILIKVARISYGILVAALGVQQIFYTDFRPVILPPWPALWPWHTFFIYLLSAVFIIAGTAIVFNKKTNIVSLILGVIFLLLFLFCQIPYELFVDPYYKHLGVWANAEKELILAGGGFVVAGSFPSGNESNQKESLIINLLEKIIPFGSVFFCITMVSFGIDHFLYTKGISVLVPAWIPGAMFWTYFAGIALFCSGVMIILRINLKLNAILLALMIFLWLLVLHIPRAIADPYSLQGNEVSSVFEAFGFSGIAYLMAYGYRTKKVLSQKS